MNAARALAALLLAVPIELGRIVDTPLFCVSEVGVPLTQAVGVPLTQAVATRVFTGLPKAAIPDEDHTRCSLQSLRIGLTRTLLKAGASMDLIQAMCRWWSAASTNLHAGLGRADCGRWVLCAQTRRNDSATSANL